jgi:hypothetical protein
VKPVTEDEIARLAGWIREQNSFSNVPLLTRETVKRVLAASMPRLRDRAMKALKIIAIRFSNMDVWHVPATLISDLELVGTSYCATGARIRELLHILEYDGLLESRGDLIRLSVKGLLARIRHEA